MRNIGNKLSPFAVDPLLFGDIMQDTYDPDDKAWAPLDQRKIGIQDLVTIGV